jgi:alkanesulfonate monooxygenase SsuD/methylene tetrahydromethanopterin reductase-like flavin-dependent oxidoreductase (luciferase family)
MLKIGINLGFGKLDDSLNDEEMYHGEIDLAVRSEALGYDSVWAVEHHFSDYSMCPDNLLLLANIAGQTKDIKLGTGAIIVPWNDPLRVAEKALMVDTLSKGRLLLGVARNMCPSGSRWMKRASASTKLPQ